MIMKKFVAILIVFFVLSAGAGCLAPDEPKDEISQFLLNLKKQTAIEFGEIVDADFNWNMETEDGVQGSVVAGKRIEALGISTEEPVKIKDFFKNEGFVADIQNIVAGTIVGIDGYQKGEMVCVVRGGISGGEEGLEAEIVSSDVIVSCGKLEGFEKQEDVARLANPASVYCKKRGGRILDILGAGGVAGYCVLPDERVCQQWKYFYSEGGECESPEVKFGSDRDCKMACEEAGEPTGNCKLTDNIEAEDINLGGCVIVQSLLCGSENKCFCGCSR